MNDYNNGDWHGWNGGECPVHPETVVDVVFDNPSKHTWYTHVADNIWWIYGEGPSNIIVFRVTKPYIEPPKPREFWVNPATGNAYFYNHNNSLIHVREVME